MATRIEHRGPDGSGAWCDAEHGFGVAHRRLSIVDLSMAGHQPMPSARGRFVIAYNGEIYNHLELRRRLGKEGAAPLWRGHSDTETLLAGVEHWGLEKTLKASVGMFALALWDRRDLTLSLARDRLGEKPLYFGFQQGVLLFGSELKALRAHPRFDAQIDRDSLALMLRYNCIPAPYSIYKDIGKLMPGCLVKFSAKSIAGAQVPPANSYWQIGSVIEAGQSRPFDGTPSEAMDALERKLVESVQSQLLSDVPLGAFLSGGIDSSLIVALMQSVSAKPVQTFTIGSHDQGYDEAQQAAAVARHIGTAHTELYVSAEDARNVIPKLPTIYCEPFSDSSQVPTYLVSELASRHVKVALSGDAADELFAGYNRYLMAASMWRRAQKLPRPARRLLAGLLTSISPASWDSLISGAGRLLPSALRMRMPGDKAHKFAGVLLAKDGRSFYLNLVSHWQQPCDVVRNSVEPDLSYSDLGNPADLAGVIHEMMAVDSQTYLPNDILVKVDRAAMANGLETRAPYLDHRLVEFAWTLPLSLKVREGEGKWLLRQVLYRHVPREFVDRPKMGFGVPLHDWLRGPLRDWAEDLLDERRLLDEGYFDPAPIREAWCSHQSGRSNQHYHLWDILMFQSWLAEQ